MKPRFRHPDMFQVLPWREWLRKELPPGHEGWVAEDLDLVVKSFSPDDPIGRFMLLELKYRNTKLNRAQEMTFGILDYLLRKADPNRRVYCGYHLLRYPNERPELCDSVQVNEETLTLVELAKWLRFEFFILPYDFKNIRKFVPMIEKRLAAEGGDDK